MEALVFLCVLAAIAFWLWRAFRNGPKGSEGRLYSTLLQRAGGDPELADRLIEHELRRRPGIARDQAIQTAIWRLDRDRQ
jgi:hypothetical protein